jgi:hypothetical protein
MSGVVDLFDPVRGVAISCPAAGIKFWCRVKQGRVTKLPHAVVTLWQLWGAGASEAQCSLSGEKH